MALTSDIQRIEKEGRLQEMPVSAAVKIYKGALLKVTAAGFASPCAAEAGAFYAGVAYESKDNTLGASGDLKVRVERKRAFEMTGAGFAQANLGEKVYASDDNTISLVQGANQQEVGTIIEFISATKVLVAQNNV